jgi:5-formyltetrahydrofolate cyclo-ligase
MTHAADQELDEAKKRCRRTAKAQRAAAAAGNADAGPALATRLLERVSLPAGAVVSVFWSLQGEIDTQPLMEALIRRGHRLALPVMLGPRRPLVFRAWTPGDSLVPAGFGTREPSADKEERVPDVLVVPLLAFDRKGYRMGYGGGFYDRTLAELRQRGPCLVIGIAYAGQEVPEVPRGARDQRLDWIVTEREAIEVAGVEGPNRVGAA